MDIDIYIYEKKYFLQNVTTTCYMEIIRLILFRQKIQLDDYDRYTERGMWNVE